MKTNNYYIDLHVLQTVPPSCVNRDDTGSPKTAVYGGVTRARVSSQAWKRAIRVMFHNEFGCEAIGKRTLKVQELIEKEMAKIDPSMKQKDIDDYAKKALEMAGLIKKSSSKDKKRKKADDDSSEADKQGSKELGALFFVSLKQIQELAILAVEKSDDEEKYMAAISQHPTLDMVLFGRMVALSANLNYDAACQVAHSISTHEVSSEYDYFTALDECKQADEQGASMIGLSEFNSYTMYRYATINVNELIRYKSNLQFDPVDLDVSSAVRAFAEAFIYSMPTGKQNTFANRTVPDMVYITIRRDQPVNLVGAFEKPVRTLEGGYAEASEKRFVEYAKQTYEKFTSAPETAFGTSRGDAVYEIAEDVKLSDMLDRLEACVSQHLSEGGEAK